MTCSIATGSKSCWSATSSKWPHRLHARRTLNDSFIILDEAQNSTAEQMKMVLTRQGFNSKMVVNGDVTQIDLPTGRRSGLLEAVDVVKGIEGISFVQFDERDVVRHSLVPAHRQSL